MGLEHGSEGETEEVTRGLVGQSMQIILSMVLLQVGWEGYQLAFSRRVTESFDCCAQMYRRQSSKPTAAIQVREVHGYK